MPFFSRPCHRFFGGFLLCLTMAFAVATHLFVIDGSPLPAIVLGTLSGFVAYRLRPMGGVLSALARRAA